MGRGVAAGTLVQPPPPLPVFVKTSTPGDIKEGMAPSAPRQRGGEMPFQFRHASAFAKKTHFLLICD